MSERQLKLGHRKEYKRKSKHTRNPSYYPRHLTKVRVNDLDADYNIPVIKEVAATRGHAKKVISKNCATDRAWHIAKKLEDNWVYVVIPSTKYAQSYQMMEHFVHHHIEEIPNPEIEKLQNGVSHWQHIVNSIYEGKVVTYQNSDQPISLGFAEKNLLDYKKGLERAPRIVTMDSGYGQLTPLVKRCDYERAIKKTIE